MLQSTLDGGDINLDSLVEGRSAAEMMSHPFCPMYCTINCGFLCFLISLGMLLEADSGNVEDLPWIFSRELVPSANPSRRPQTVLAAPRRLASRPPHRVMRQMDEEIQMRLREVCGPYTCECSSTDRLKLLQHRCIYDNPTYRVYIAVTQSSTPRAPGEQLFQAGC